MSSSTSEPHRVSSSSSVQPCHHFSLEEIQSATKDFDDRLVIGEGGFGKVYKGRICIQETSHVVAIKRLDSMSNQGAAEFRAEIEMLSKLRHPNLVSLIGFCDENKEMVLVYEYMPHGTLDHHLHKADKPLSWVQRLKIALGAARGLDYLHSGVGTHHGVIHRDIKSSNILLDENWAAMISDFGLSKVGPTNQSISYVEASVKGTFGYLDPEYFYTRRLTRKTDVFAFGVVLFELLSGRRPVDISLEEEQCSLVRWAQKCVKDRKLDQIVDSSIKGTISPKYLRRFAQLAYRCLYSVPKERPSMNEVVASLVVLLELQEKHDNAAESSGNTRFTWKFPKYLAPMTKQKSDQGGTSSQVAIDLKKFTFLELQCATRNFANDTCLGCGRYVDVHKGWVDKTTYSPSIFDTGLPIAVKRLHRYGHLDLDVLKELNHPNLVKLIGCCLRFEEAFLVYEFMPLGNFEDCLCTRTISELPLVKKVKIAVGIARGMAFLKKKGGEMYYRSTVGKSWFDRHKAFFDQDLTNYTGDDDDIKYDRLSLDLPVQPPSYDVWIETIDEYDLDRRKIVLDEIRLQPFERNAAKGRKIHGLTPSYEMRGIPCTTFLAIDFTVKLSNYNGTLGGYHTYDNLSVDDVHPLKLGRDLSGFTTVFTEVLIGERISDHGNFKKIDDFLCQQGKKSWSLIAELCFEICNEVDAESRMQTILEEYEEYFPRLGEYFLEQQQDD